MRRPNPILPMVHGAAATVALLTIALFWGATIASELIGDPSAVQGVALVAGAVNLVLLGRSVRDGLRLRDARRRAEQRGAPRPSPAHPEPVPPSQHAAAHA